MAVRAWCLNEAARRVIWEPAGYKPNPVQREIHLDGHRCKLIAGGERAGKSYVSAMELLCWLTISQGGLFWIVGPDYELARPELLHLVDGASRIGLVSEEGLSLPRQGSCVVKTVLGSIVETKTAQDARKLAGRAPDGLLMVEAAQQDYEAFLRCRGRVAETRGPLLLSGTFEGSMSWYADLWNEWQGENSDDGRSFSLPSWTNEAIYPGGREDPEIKALEARFPADVFQERFGGVPCPPASLVYKEFRHTVHVRHCYEKWREARTVWLAIDPGWAGAYAVEACIIENGTVYNIDEIYAQGRTAQDIIAECKQREWWSKVRGGAIDVAGRQHQGMESHVEIWQRLAGVPLYCQPVPIPDGILRYRTFLRDPSTGEPRLFHDPRCKGIIGEYGLYKYHDIREGRPVSEMPIDANNHANKALGYFLVCFFGFVNPPRLQKVQMHIRRK